jgi:outer membrane protein OmpA-like peptidoglycan-associated protein
MNKRNILVLCVVILSTTIMAQINLGKVIDRSIKKAERSVENRVGKRIDKTVDKTLDTVEDSIFGTGKTAKKSTEKTTGNSKTTTKNQTGQTAGNEVDNASVSNDQTKPELTWSRFDFVPGTEIIFEDDFTGEKNGEFPSKWDLVQGNFENASFDGSNVIYHIKCNMNGGGGVTPMLKNAKEDYLPEEFTIEFDAYFSENHGGSYTIYFADYKNQRNLDKTFPIGNKWIRIYKNSADGNSIEQNYYPGFKSGMYDKTPKWRHVAISFNKRALKVYLDDARVLNIPNLGYNPTGFSIGKHNTEGKNPGYTKNFRIAKGAVPLYDKFLTDGKFITTGIKFDVNKATIKPESMGTINYVVKMMTDHPELNFSVQGHTDSDGEVAANQKLSEARAKSVVDTMVKLGISSSRLTSTGFGESKPMTGNDTTEGKAQNRRVEFVKQ